MMNSWKIICFISGCLLSFSTLFAQNAVELLDQYTEAYPDASYIVLNRIKNINIDLVDGEIKISESFEEESFYLDTDAGYLTEESIPFSSFISIDNIEAKTMLPKGKRFKSLEVKEFKTKSEKSSGIFHDDRKSMFFNFPSLQKGAKTNLSYTKSIKEPRFLSGDFFVSGVPVLYQEFVIEVHPDVELAIKEFNTEDLDLKFQQSEKDSKTIYKWTLKNQEKFEFESDGPTLTYYAPHIIPHIASYKKEGETVRLLGEVDDLFSWYNTLYSNVNTNTDDMKLKALVEEITEGAETDLEKVKRIYYWTQDNIKYIAFEEGMNGFIPRNTDQVVDQLYGDCKDMSTCISNLLNYTDVDASVVWIGSDDIPYTYSELPTPAVDNHMIAAYKNGDEYIFLDATSEFTPFGKPSSFIQGKEALVRTGKASYELVKVPIVPAKENLFSDVSKVRIEDGKLLGEATVTVEGYHKSNMKYKLQGRDEKELFKYFSAYLKKGSNKFLLEEYNLKGDEDKDVATEISYTFNIDDYVFENGDEELYVNLNFYDLYEGMAVKEDRVIPRKKKFKTVYRTEVSLEIPDGYEVTYLPEKKNISYPKFSFQTEYKVEGDKVIYTEIATEDYLLLEKEDFSDWNAFCDEIDEITSQNLILTNSK